MDVNILLIMPSQYSAVVLVDFLEMSWKLLGSDMAKICNLGV